jgi:hypothetical protein
MLAFFAKTWVLWWMLAVVVILRWFHVLSAAAPQDPSESPEHDSDEYTIRGQLASRTWDALRDLGFERRIATRPMPSLERVAISTTQGDSLEPDTVGSSRGKSKI